MTSFDSEVAAARVTDVVKRIFDGRDKRVVLAGISFSIARRELVVVRGPSGSGKTTLLAVVGAMLSPTSGEVHLDGEPTSRLRDAHRAEVRRRKVGFVFQDLQLVDGLSAIENVLLPCIPDGVQKADRTRARELLDRFGLAEQGHLAARGLSGGERQRVALARALLKNPPLLVLDEPTAHLDDPRTTTLLGDLAALAGEGRALLVATHDARVSTASAVSRVLELAEGSLVPQA
jgi:putative ABC transport system ATP-binding protein